MGMKPLSATKESTAFSVSWLIPSESRITRSNSWPEEMACEKVDSLASAMDTSMACESSRMRSCRRAVAEMSRMFL